MNVTSTLLAGVPGLVHGFGTYEKPLPSSFYSVWQSLQPVWKQVHGNSIACVQIARQNCGEADGFFTFQSGLPIGVITADCVPILLASKCGKKIAAVHSGWRGTRSGILVRLWDNLRLEGEKPQDWVAAVGPAIGPCCYEVSQELADDFSREFSSLGEDVAVPHDRKLDLQRINLGILIELGMADVDIIRHCTFCSQSPQYHSFRREGGGTRQYSLIVRGI